jgi:hypothetical protein
MGSFSQVVESICAIRTKCGTLISDAEIKMMGVLVSMRKKRKRIEATIEFDYKYPKYVSFQVLDPHFIGKTDREYKKKFDQAVSRGGYFEIRYPEWTRKAVLKANIQDLRKKEVSLSEKYNGSIEIGIDEIQDGSSVQVGSLSGRELNVLQWQFRYEQRRRGIAREENIYGIVPIAKFNVKMNLEMPKASYERMIEASEAIGNLSADDLAEKRIEDFVENLVEIMEMGLENVPESMMKDPKYHQATRVLRLRGFLPDYSEFKPGSAIVDLLTDRESEIYQAFHGLLKEEIEKDPQVEWSKEFLNLRQRMYQDVEFGRKNRNYKLRKDAKETLELIEETNEIASDIFKIFRYYMNIHLASVKYQLDQYWLKLLPEWEIDYFYHRNKVMMDDIPIHAVPFYSVGAFWMPDRKGADNIHRNQWDQYLSLSFERLERSQSGLSSDGMLTRAYEALLGDDSEVCVTLASSAIERRFAEIYNLRKSDEQKDRWRELSLPSKTDSFRKTLKRWQPIFKTYSGAIRSSEREITELWKRMYYVRELRNSVLHNAISVETYVSRAQEGRSGYYRPEACSISKRDVPLKSSHKKPKPYHWRVVSFLHRSSWTTQNLCIRIRSKLEDILSDTSGG